MLILTISSSATPRVLPVNLEAEAQEDFILQNIDMPDLPGLSEEAVKEVDKFQFECFGEKCIKIKFDFKNNDNRSIVSCPKIIVGIVSQQLYEEHKMSGMDLQTRFP